MKTKTLQALKDTIAHWERMRDNRTQRESPSFRDCALCSLSFKWGEECIGCPIYERTGATACQNTPFQKANSAFYSGTNAEWKTAAQAEIDFLKSLLP